MKSNSKNKLLFFIRTTIVVVFLNTLSLLYAQSIELSFDSLYPKTWYEKSLDSLISTWQLLETCNNKNEEEMILVCDIILGKLTFAKCCIQKIKDENIPLLTEDYEYLMYVKDKIRSLLKKIIVTEKLRHVVSFCEEIM